MRPAEVNQQRPTAVRLRKQQDTGQVGTCSPRKAEQFLEGGTEESQRVASMSFTHISPPNTTLKRKSHPNIQMRKPRFKCFRVWPSSTSRCTTNKGKARILHWSRPRSSELNSMGWCWKTHMSESIDTVQDELQRVPKTLLTWSESSVTRSPNLVIPSSFRSFRWGQRARQKALAMCSVSRLWSAGSLRQLCWSSLSRKNTCSPNKRDF